MPMVVWNHILFQILHTFFFRNKISEKHLRVIECTRMPSSASDEESDDEVGEEDEETEGEDTKRGSTYYNI